MEETSRRRRGFRFIDDGYANTTIHVVVGLDASLVRGCVVASRRRRAEPGNWIMATCEDKWLSQDGWRIAAIYLKLEVFRAKMSSIRTP
jgi:hypothetical protein